MAVVTYTNIIELMQTPGSKLEQASAPAAVCVLHHQPPRRAALLPSASSSSTHGFPLQMYFLLPQAWNKPGAEMPAPEIAITYWRLSKDATFFDVIEQVRGRVGVGVGYRSFPPPPPTPVRV